VKSLGYFVFHFIYNLKSSKLFACLLACFITPLELHFALLKKEGKTAFGKKTSVCIRKSFYNLLLITLICGLYYKHVTIINYFVKLDFPS
jgi:hypothetical protein